MHRHIRDVQRLPPPEMPQPIVILARHILRDVSELCTRMALINRGFDPDEIEFDDVRQKGEDDHE